VEVDPVNAGRAFSIQTSTFVAPEGSSVKRPCPTFDPLRDSIAAGLRRRRGAAKPARQSTVIIPPQPIRGFRIASFLPP
jgi:hypothetical protein